ncbi:MAG: hypothetical protein ACK4TL_10255 [Hyphomicrobiaceae bacterium]
MKFAKLALAGALSAFLFTSAQAAPALGPATKITSDNVIELAQAKKKAVKKKAAPKKKAAKKPAKKKVAKKPAKKKVAKVGPGRCGAMKYWSAKQKKCLSKG